MVWALAELMEIEENGCIKKNIKQAELIGFGECWVFGWGERESWSKKIAPFTRTKQKRYGFGAEDKS